MYIPASMRLLASFPLPDPYPDMPGSAFLGDIASETVVYQKQVLNLQKQIEILNADIAAAADNYQKKKISDAAYTRLYSQKQSQISTLTSQIEQINTRLSILQASPLSPAEQAKATRESLTQYAQQVALIKSGGFYDYGMGSGKRNVFYGMGDNMNNDGGVSFGSKKPIKTADWSNDGGVTNPSPTEFGFGELPAKDGGIFIEPESNENNLGVDFFSAITEGIKSSYKEAFAGVKAPAVKLPSVQPTINALIPASIRAYAEPIKKIATAVIAKAKAQKPSQPPTTSATNSTGTSILPKVAINPTFLYIGAGIAALGAALIFAGRRK